MFEATKLIFLKEMNEVKRDKRAWLTVVLVSLIFPLYILGTIAFSVSLKENSGPPEYSVIGGENAPALISFLHEEGLLTTDELKEGAVTLIIPDDYVEKLSAGILPKIIVRGDLADNPVVMRGLLEAVDDYSKEVARARLLARGVSPVVMVPFEISLEDTGEVSFIARYFAPMFVVMFLMVPTTAFVPAAIDCTAGERERHGLFPLLLQPISPLSIATGKLMMLVFLALTSLLITMVTAFVSFSYIKIEGVNFGLDMSFYTGTVLTMVLIPALTLVASMIMGVASFGKSFKEGQTYVMFGMFLPLGFVGLGFALEGLWRIHLPFWAEITVLTNVFSGQEVSWGPLLLNIVGYVILIGFFLGWMGRSIRRQALTGQG